MAQKQYKFSLSIHDKHNRQVKKIVDGLLAKGNGALSQSIRDGLRLLNDLRRGNVTVLLEMFPDVMDKLCPPPGTNNDDLKNEIADLKRIILEQGRAIPNAPEPAYKQSGKGIGAGVTFSLPLVDDSDDDDDTIVITESQNNTSFQNFMASFMELENAPPKEIENARRNRND